MADFIWNGHKPKLKMSVLQGKKQEGGMRLVDLKSRDDALKIQWIFRLHQQDPILTSLAYYHVKSPLKGEIFWQCNF